MARKGYSANSNVLATGIFGAGITVVKYVPFILQGVLAQ
jgi:hypothetical protein